MNIEQRAYLKSVLPAVDDHLFREFEQVANVTAMIKHFEEQLFSAWQTFVKVRLLRHPDGRAAQQYQKLQMEDFGATQKGPKPQRPIIPVQPISAPKPGFSQSVMASAKPAPAPAQPPQSKETDTAASSPALPPARIPANMPQLPAGAQNAATAATTADTANTPSPAVTKHAEPQRPIPRPTLRFVMRNARQGEPYEGDIQCEPKVPGLRLLDLTLPEKAELLVDLAAWRIIGTPAVSGEFTLGLRYAFPDDPDGVSHTGTAQFVINADPKTLWKDLPSDKAAPYWKEDTAASVCEGSHAKIVAARKRGRSHAHKGTCCDDDYFTLCDEASGWHLAVVADGAGSAKFSRRGSQIVTQTVGQFLTEVFADHRGQALAAAIEDYARSSAPDMPAEKAALAQQKTRNELFTTLGYAAHHAVHGLRQEVKDRSDLISSAKELSTTLLIGLARKVGDRWFCAAYWVGDGAVAVYRRHKGVHLLGAADSGEFSGQTRFLDSNEVTQEALLRRLRFELVEDMTAFLLMSDGVSDPKFPSEAAMEKLEGWDRLWDDLEAGATLTASEPGQETRLLDWLDFWAPGEYDDRTIAIIY